MILLQVKQFVKRREKVTFDDICHHFDLRASAAEAILQRLIRQGHIQKLTGQNCSTGSCHSSCQQQQDWFIWLDKKYSPLKLNLEIQ